MRKLALAIAIAVTACNLAIGVAYAAVCGDTHGNRFCGATCATGVDGSCACSGACSKDERDWVGGAGGHGELEEVFDY